MDVQVDADAANFARAHGGAIYLWASGDGLLHVRTARPEDATDWDRFAPGGNVEVFVAPSASGVESWRVSLIRFPWKRLVATSEITGGIGQDPSGGIGSGVW
jgi:hypothetical protein